MVLLGFQLCYQPLRKTDSRGKQSSLDHQLTDHMVFNLPLGLDDGFQVLRILVFFVDLCFWKSTMIREQKMISETALKSYVSLGQL